MAASLLSSILTIQPSSQLNGVPQLEYFHSMPLNLLGFANILSLFSLCLRELPGRCPSPSAVHAHKERDILLAPSQVPSSPSYHEQKESWPHVWYLIMACVKFGCLEFESPLFPLYHVCFWINGTIYGDARSSALLECHLSVTTAFSCSKQNNHKQNIWGFLFQGSWSLGLLDLFRF